VLHLFEVQAGILFVEAGGLALDVVAVADHAEVGDGEPQLAHGGELAVVVRALEGQDASQEAGKRQAESHAASVLRVDGESGRPPPGGSPPVKHGTKGP